MEALPQPRTAETQHHGLSVPGQPQGCLPGGTIPGGVESGGGAGGKGQDEGENEMGGFHSKLY